VYVVTERGEDSKRRGRLRQAQQQE
jgi:hypothetical protein